MIFIVYHLNNLVLQNYPWWFDYGVVVLGGWKPQLQTKQDITHITSAGKFFRPQTLHAPLTPSAVSWINPHRQSMAEPSPSTNHQQRFSRKKRKLTLELETPIVNHTHASKHTKRRNSRGIDEQRKWVFSARDCTNYIDKFVFVSYNILGVENASNHKDLYVNVIPRFLKWEYRRRAIRKEISRYSPGILCFQASFLRLTIHHAINYHRY
ncbi:hypothetical protein R6Q59_023975 [Mikania micrantha]